MVKMMIMVMMMMMMMMMTTMMMMMMMMMMMRVSPEFEAIFLSIAMACICPPLLAASHERPPSQRCQIYSMVQAGHFVPLGWWTVEDSAGFCVR